MRKFCNLEKDMCENIVHQGVIVKLENIFDIFDKIIAYYHAIVGNFD